MKGRSAVAVILILPVTACASLGVKTSGISGPVAWQRRRAGATTAARGTATGAVCFASNLGELAMWAWLFCPGREDGRGWERRGGPCSAVRDVLRARQCFHRRRATFYTSGTRHSP